MTRKPSAATVLILVLLALMTGLVPAGRAAAEPSSLDEIYRTLGVDDVSADYVVLIDTSLSMNEGNLYAGVRESLRQFFAALAPEDMLTLISVSDSARLIWEGKAGTAPDDITAKLPPAPTGNFTDLGTGIEAAVAALETRLNNPIASVVMLTDGQHDPPPRSGYPYTEGYAWQRLAQRAALLEQQITPYAIQLRGVNGAATLRRVFPSARIVSPDAIDQLTAKLSEPKAAVKAAKARGVLGADPRSTVLVEWPASLDSAGGFVRLRSTSRYLPLEVSGLRIDTGSPGLHIDVPSGPFTLAPGASTVVPVSVRWDAVPMSWRPLETVRRPYRLRLAGTVSSPWSPVLGSEIGVAVEPALAGVESSGTASQQRGSLAWWLSAAGLLLALLVLGTRVRWLRLHPVPGGTLVASSLDDGQSRGSIRLAGRRVAILASSLGIPGTGWVSGRRHGMRSERVLSITYSRDGSANGRAVGECAAGGSVEVHGVVFEWRH